MSSSPSIFAVAWAVALSAACGDSTNSVPSSGDVANYQQLAFNVQSAATTYRTNAGGADMSTIAVCQAQESQYDAQVRPWVLQMMQMSGGMDSLMATHAGSMQADMACDSTAMLEELNHHQQIACSASSLSDDRSEAMRHAAAMIGYAGHAAARSIEMMYGLGGGAWNFVPMMSGCASGQGGTMPGGGMMGGGH